MKRTTWILCILAMASAACQSTSSNAGQASQTQLIPRADLFGSSQKWDAAVSVGQEFVAYSAPLGGVPHIWVGPADTPDQATPITRDEAVGIPQFRWSALPNRLLLIGDNAGDERWRLASLDIETNDYVKLTPGDGERASILAVPISHPDEIIIATNERDPAFSDVYRVNIKTGERTLALRNTHGFEDFLISQRMEVLLARSTDEASGDFIIHSQDENGTWFQVMRVAYEDTRGFRMLGSASNEPLAYLLDSTGRDVLTLVSLNLETGDRQVVAIDERSDIVEVVSDPVSNIPIAYATNYAGKSWTAVPGRLAKGEILEKLSAKVEGRLDFHAWSPDGNGFTAYVSGQQPAYYVQADVTTNSVERLLEVYPSLTEYEFSVPTPAVIPTRDNQEMVLWYTLPHGSDPEGDGIPNAPAPTVMLPHGGPWDQSREGFDPWTQWLANRGYAVIMPNFRGSTGYGKAWLNAGDLEWGGMIQSDLVDALDWAIEAGISDADRIGVMGASFGGYLALRSLSSTPERFACGVSNSGPANLITLYESLPEYWGAFLAEYRRRVGDPTTPEGRTLLTAHSPLFQAENIRAPLLLGQGANDSRVPTSEAEQIVEAMQSNDQQVTYLLYGEEGHGNRLPANNRAGTAITEQFLSACLGGESEPIGDDLKGSTLSVPYGHEFIDGLSEALNRLVAME